MNKERAYIYYIGTHKPHSEAHREAFAFSSLREQGAELRATLTRRDPSLCDHTTLTPSDMTVADLTSQLDDRIALLHAALLAPGATTVAASQDNRFLSTI